MSFQLSTLQVHRVVSLSGTGDAREGKNLPPRQALFVILSGTGLTMTSFQVCALVSVLCPEILCSRLLDKVRSDQGLYVLLLSLAVAINTPSLL